MLNLNLWTESEIWRFLTFLLCFQTYSKLNIKSGTLCTCKYFVLYLEFGSTNLGLSVERFLNTAYHPQIQLVRNLPGIENLVSFSSFLFYFKSAQAYCISSRVIRIWKPCVISWLFWWKCGFVENVLLCASPYFSCFYL